MFYRPNFCCNCGEKIERADWPFLASRRFCDLCETEHKINEWVRRSIIVVAGVIAAAGIFNIFRPTPPGQFNLEAKSSLTTTAAAPVERSLDANLSATPASPQQSQSGLTANNLSATNSARTSSGSLRAVPNAVEPVFYCGAMTKKGTPCS